CLRRSIRQQAAANRRSPGRLPGRTPPRRESSQHRPQRTIIHMKKTKELPTEELAETWADDKGGEYIQINPDGSVVEVAHGSCMATILSKNVATDLPDFQKWAAIRAWMESKQFWPNIWSVNDHVNISLYDAQGNY